MAMAVSATGLGMPCAWLQVAEFAAPLATR